ncbi:hypothetical protein KKC13_09790 [bacterium]|nr:hypothetical protein [bacterium]MBU1958071.1 hypothetical protein [bacterium]
MKKILLILGVIGLLLLGAYFVLTLNKASSNDAPEVITVPSLPLPAAIVKEEEVAYYAPDEEPVASTMSGNDKFSKVTVGEDSDDNVMTVRKHTYGVVSSKEELEALEHTMTFVLLPRNLSGNSNSDRAIYKRYVQVLELIQELREVDTGINKPKSAMRKHENQFILFSNKKESRKVTVENYDYALSHKVLDFFQEKYPDVAFSQEGPYLITTAKNVLKEQKNFSFLYVNLSSFNNSSVKEVIESYKQRLIDRGDSDVKILEAWRFTLLSALTNLNADIHIVQTAMAGDL